MSDRTVLPVTGASPYDVVVGHGLAGEVVGLLGPTVQRVAVVHPAGPRGAREARPRRPRRGVRPDPAAGAGG